jgi:hypothetical protein
MLLLGQVVFMMMLSGCSNEAIKASASAPGPAATLRIVPERPAPLQEALLELTLRGPDGRPLTGATVSMDLVMPAMVMPPNQPVVTEGGNGVYSAKALVTMAGEWEVRVRVESSGGGSLFTFPFRTR